MKFQHFGQLLRVCVCVLLDDVKIVFFYLYNRHRTIWLKWNQKKNNIQLVDWTQRHNELVLYFLRIWRTRTPRSILMFRHRQSKSNRKIRCFVGCHAKIARFHVQISDGMQVLGRIAKKFGHWEKFHRFCFLLLFISR